MNSKRNALFVLAAAVAVLGAGCSGLGASGSISPATFLLPGFGQTSPHQEPRQENDPLRNSPQIAAYSAPVTH